MARVEFFDVDAGIGLASTWGTAVDADMFLVCRNISVNPTRAQSVGMDLSTSSWMRYFQQLQLSVNWSVSGMCTYDGAWPMLLAMFFGSAGAPSEQNSGEADYLHTLSWSAAADGNFFTMAWEAETDQVLEIPSCMTTSFQLSQAANGVMSFNASGIGDQVVYSGTTGTPSNTNADLAGITAPDYEEMVMAGANCYLRYDDYSASVALSSADDMPALNWSVTFTRDLQTQHVIQGSNTPYIKQPVSLGKVGGSFNFTLCEIDDSNTDFWDHWESLTQKMAEISFDGTQIGSGANRSFTLELPSLTPTPAAPTGFGVQQGQLRTPTGNFQISLPAAAPASMTNTTPTALLINNFATDYLA